VEQTLFVGIKPYKDYRKFREIINRINEAALKRRTIDMIYRTMSRGGEESRRRVDPYRILFFDGTFYLIGWCHLRKEVRMFVLDRIKMLSMTDETFEVPGDFDLETYMRSPFRVIHDRPVEVTVRFDKKVAGYIKEKIWHHTQRIEPHKDGSIIFSAADRLEDRLDLLVVLGEAGFQLSELAGQLLVCTQHLAKFDERSHYKYGGFYGARCVQHAGSHYRSMFREGMRKRR